MQIDNTKIPEGVRFIAAALSGKGFRSWIVGGCVRDLLRGAGDAISDWDLATDAKPEQVLALFEKTIPTGLQHGTVTVMYQGEGFEVTTLRGEGAYSDGRRPDEVFFVDDIEEDLARRDFTVNAIAADPITGEIIDPWGGVQDLQLGILRAVGDPMERFQEDGLRVLRAARFCATLEFTLDERTEAAIRPNLETFSKVARERVLAEWVKVIEKANHPSIAFEIMRRTGILQSIGGPLASATPEQFRRAMFRLNHGAPRKFPLAMAAMLLEVRNPYIEVWLRGLKLSNADREMIMKILQSLQGAPSFAEMRSWEDSDIRRWASKIGRRYLAEVTQLYLLDPHGGLRWDAANLSRRFDRLLGAHVPLELKGLDVTGDELQEHLGIPPSRKLGEVLKKLLDFVLEEPHRNKKASLLEHARTLI